MSLETIAAIGTIASPDRVSGAGTAGAAAPADGAFGSWFVRELDSVNASLGRADADMRALATGEAPSLHEVMIHLEEAKLSFQLMAQVRNRLLEAYQEVMRTQV